MNITCIRTFDYLVNKVQATQMKIFGFGLQGDAAKKEAENLIKNLFDIAKTDKIDEHLSFEQIQELAQMINDLTGTGEQLITISELASNLLPDKSFGNSREPGVNGSLDTPESNFEDTRRSSSNFIERVYQGSAVTSTLLRFFQNETIKKIMVDLENNMEILGNSESLNIELKNLQESLYNNIIEYLDQMDPTHGLSRELFTDEESNLDKLTEYLKNSQNTEINLFYNHRHMPQTTLAEWRNKAAIMQEDYETKLRAYNSYFILQHFDSMLTKTFGSLILYKETEKNKIIYPKEKYTYNFLDDHNRIVSWQQEDLQQKGAFDLMPKSLQTFIESCEILNFDNSKLSRTGQYLTKDHITYMVSKIKNDFRSKEYNEKGFVYVKNPEQKSIEQIKEEIKSNFADTIDTTKLSDEAITQIAILLKTDSLETLQTKRGAIKILTFRDVINSIRHSPKQLVKLVFDLREAMTKEFPTTIEERVFKNIKYYFFNDDHSLYSSSKRMYGQLAQLFDTTSISTYTQYKVDNDGSLALIRLNPARLTQELNILKNRINSSFVPGECDNLLETYNVQTEYRNLPNEQVRVVTFEIKDWGGKLKFRYNTRAPQSSRWIMIKEDAHGNTIEFNPATQKAGNIISLTDTDFNMLCKLAKDVLGVDLYENKELRTAYIDQFDNFHQATLNLINCIVPILANIKIFREKPTELEYITDVNALSSDVPYTYRIKQGNQYINGKFYLVICNHFKTSFI